MLGGAENRSEDLYLTSLSLHMFKTTDKFQLLHLFDLQFKFYLNINS